MDLWNKVPVGNTTLEVVFIEMIFKVTRERGTKEKENKKSNRTTLEKFHTSKLDNLDQMDKWLKTFKLPRLNHEKQKI